jgi:hypothetical protein
MNAYDLFDRFVDSERSRFETADNNKFALACSNVLRYCDFLSLISRQHKVTASEFARNHERLMSLASDSQPQEGHNLFQVHRDLEKQLELEIESFYIFAKMMLDMAAKLIEFYFGDHNGPSLRSHSKLVKNLKEYCQKQYRDLPVPETLLSSARRLQTDISDFRDKQFTHPERERARRGAWSIQFTTSEDVHMARAWLYPKVKDTYDRSYSLKNIWSELDAYLESIVEFLSANSAKSKLTLKPVEN